MLSKKKKIGIVAGLLIALCGGGYGSYSYYHNQQVMQEQANVETVTVHRENIHSTVSATGTIRPVNSVEVSSKITARLKTVDVKENERVTAGQVLATLDAKDYAAKRDQAQFKVTNTKAKYDRALYLYNKGAYSSEQLEDAEFNYNSAVSSLSQMDNDLAETSIVAPISGVVVGEPKTAGTMAVAGSDNPTVIMRIADMSTKEIQAKIDETDIGNVKVGQKATFTVDAFNGKTFTATVSKISQTDTGNSWDTSSKSSSTSTSVVYYYVTLDVEDPDNVLLPAMTARVNITTADKNDALVVPISTLKTDSSGSYVMVKGENGQQEKRYVEVGIYSDENVEILSGLSEGEEVVSSFKATEAKVSQQNQKRGPHPM